MLQSVSDQIHSSDHYLFNLIQLVYHFVVSLIFYLYLIPWPICLWLLIASFPSLWFFYRIYLILACLLLLKSYKALRSQCQGWPKLSRLPFDIIRSLPFLHPMTVFKTLHQSHSCVLTSFAWINSLHHLDEILHQFRIDVLFLNPRHSVETTLSLNLSNQTITMLVWLISSVVSRIAVRGPYKCQWVKELSSLMNSNLIYSKRRWWYVIGYGVHCTEYEHWI